MNHNSVRQLLLIRPRPLPDELFSSWLTRLAYENGAKVHRFAQSILKIRGKAWYRNIDLREEIETTARVSMLTGVPPERVLDTLLSSYEGVLYCGRSSSPASVWLLPARNQGRRRQIAAQQYCPECLKADEVPYFRRVWRTILPVCTVHGTMLHERCYHCQRPLNPHAWDFGFWERPWKMPWGHCSHCRVVLSEATPMPAADPDAVWLCRQLQEGMATGRVSMGGESLPIFDFAEGVYFLLRVIASNGQTSDIRRPICTARGQLTFRPVFTGRQRMVRNIEVEDRLYLFGLVGWVLRGWPHRFIAAARSADLTWWAFIQYSGREIPAWVNSACEQELRVWK